MSSGAESAPDTLHASAVRQLSRWRAPSPAQDGLRLEYLDHLTRHADAVWKHGPPAHLTASCFVLDPSARRALLTHHAKGRFWVQVGGHCEPVDTDLADAARREGREESGIATLSLVGDEPVDLDRHVLPGAFGRCREHLDVAFVAVVAADAVPRVSAESLDVAWFDVEALPGEVPADLPPRLRRVADLLRHR